jgi:hypothetical protein
VAELIVSYEGWIVPFRMEDNQCEDRAEVLKAAREVLIAELMAADDSELFITRVDQGRQRGPKWMSGR